MSTNEAVLDADLDAPLDLSSYRNSDIEALWNSMLLIREFEERVNKLFLQGRIPGTIHLSLGQEACAAGAASTLRADDWITITHRGHGQAIAKGVPPSTLMAELFARDTGCCRGHGGSLHVGDIAYGAVPGIAIVGAATPIAAGIAYAFREEGSDRVALSFMGDGSFGEGDTHEGINLAALWQLPVVYLCENNYYSISTPMERQMRVKRLAEWASAYGMPALTVDGNNVFAVREAVAQAVARARSGEGPTFVECLTYRRGGHKRDDPATYRPQEEVDRWLARDPIQRLEDALGAHGREELIAEGRRTAAQLIDEAVAFAEDSPPARMDVS